MGLRPDFWAMWRVCDAVRICFLRSAGLGLFKYLWYKVKTTVVECVVCVGFGGMFLEACETCSWVWYATLVNGLP